MAVCAICGQSRADYLSVDVSVHEVLNHQLTGKRQFEMLAICPACWLKVMPQAPITARRSLGYTPARALVAYLKEKAHG